MSFYLAEKKVGLHCQEWNIMRFGELTFVCSENCRKEERNRVDKTKSFYVIKPVGQVTISVLWKLS